jgi:hypothetical protein
LSTQDYDQSHDPQKLSIGFSTKKMLRELIKDLRSHEPQPSGAHPAKAEPDTHVPQAPKSSPTAPPKETEKASPLLIPTPDAFTDDERNHKLPTDDDVGHTTKKQIKALWENLKEQLMTTDGEKEGTPSTPPTVSTPQSSGIISPKTSPIPHSSPVKFSPNMSESSPKIQLSDKEKNMLKMLGKMKQ